MTPSFQETKTWGRSSKHHYNDILTNMQTRDYHPLISREKAHNTLAMHTAVSPTILPRPDQDHHNDNSHSQCWMKKFL